MPRVGPMIRRWQLGAALRMHRETAGASIREAAVEIGVQPGTMSKIEGGRQAIRVQYVKLLAAMYEVPADARADLLGAAEEANQPGWWVSYSRWVPDWFRLFLAYESEASDLRSYESELVPGLLQTPDYARATVLATRPDSSPADLDRQVELRRARQERMTTDDAPTMHVVLNEAVLRRLVGGPRVMRAQLEHVADLSEHPDVTVQLLPFAAGAHPAMTAPFLLLGFAPEPRMNCVYLENGRGALYLEKEQDLQRYEAMFAQLTGMALDEQATRDALTKVANDL
jgi:transcriptional regulator with XRE-family HTH domain